MELSAHAHGEGESLLRRERGAVVMSTPRNIGWDTEEKAPFLRNEPVKLTPAWEGSNLPNDTLNLKGIIIQEPEPLKVEVNETEEPKPVVQAVDGVEKKKDQGITMDLAPPRDKWHLIYLTLILHGVGTLIAWNMFITAKDYFVKYKLANTTYSDSYLVFVGYASHTPNFLFSWFNVFIVLGGDLATRIVWSLMVEVLVFVVTIALAMVDSTAWPAAFFWITMISVFVLNACNAVFQNSVYGVAARLPQKYTGAVVLGSNVCGLMVVLMNWLTDSLGGGLRTSAIYYFIGGMFVLLVCFDTYFALPLNRFYRYHDTLQQRTFRVNPALASTSPQAPQKTPYGTILKQCWLQLYNVWVVFFVSLAIFPAVHSDIFSVTDPGKTNKEGFLAGNFVRVTCFLTFNLMAMCGSITASLVQFPSRRWLTLFTTVRVVFIPLFLLCNYHPKDTTRTLAVVFNQDWIYWVFALLMAWSHGHASSLGMMYATANVAPEHASKAGMLAAAMLVTGILTGIAFSGLGPTIVTMDLWKNI